MDFLQIDHIDYLKLDIEGAEFNLFRTMTQNTANKIKQISCEIHPEFFDGDATKFITDRLNELGFKFELHDARILIGVITDLLLNKKLISRKELEKDIVSAYEDELKQLKAAKRKAKR